MRDERVEWPQVDVCCVWIPQLPLRVAVLRRPDWDGLPLVMGDGPNGRVVKLASPEAERAGITPGLPLREVLALCRDTVIVEADQAQVDTVMDGLVAKLQRVSPLVEQQEDRVYLGLRGLEDLYHHNLRELERAVRMVVPPLLTPRLGVATGKFAAGVAAATAPLAGMAVVPQDATAGFLAPLPVAHLPLPPNDLHRLGLLGLRTIGEVARLPFAAVQAQFGRAGARAWLLANGQQADPVLPQRFSDTVRVTIRFDDPLIGVDAFFAALKVAVARALGGTADGVRAVRRVRLRSMLASGAAWEQVLTLKAALTGRDAVYRALKDKLQVTNTLPPAPFEDLTLELLDLGKETGKQPSLFSANARQHRQLQEAAQQLRARYGYVPLYHVIEVEPWSRIPERRWALMPCDL